MFAIKRATGEKVISESNVIYDKDEGMHFAIYDESIGKYLLVLITWNMDQDIRGNECNIYDVKHTASGELMYNYFCKGIILKEDPSLEVIKDCVMNKDLLFT